MLVPRHSEYPASTPSPSTHNGYGRPAHLDPFHGLEATHGSVVHPPPLTMPPGGVLQPFPSILDQPGFPDSPDRESPHSDTSALDVPSPYSPDKPMMPVINHGKKSMYSGVVVFMLYMPAGLLLFVHAYFQRCCTLHVLYCSKQYLWLCVNSCCLIESGFVY